MKSSTGRRNSDTFPIVSMSGSSSKSHGCISRISSMLKIFRSNYQRKPKSSSTSISSGRIQCLEPKKIPWYWMPALVRHSSEDSNKTILPLRRFKRNWKTISLLRELLSHVSTSCPTMSFSKSCLRQEMLRLYSPISESALIT